MITVRESEQRRFGLILKGDAKRYGLSPREYLQKVQYHREAARLGEYVAMRFMDELLQSLPVTGEPGTGTVTAQPMGVSPENTYHKHATPCLIVSSRGLPLAHLLFSAAMPDF